MSEKEYWNASTVYDRILLLCERLGWNISTLATRANLTPSTVYSYRYRETVPSIETLATLCDAMGITLSMFFVNDEQGTATLLDTINALSPESRSLLVEVAKRMT